MNFIFKNCKQFATSEHYSKTNGMGSTKWTYHKELSFASNYFIFLKILFQFKNLLYRDDLKAGTLVVNDLRLATKGFGLESGC